MSELAEPCRDCRAPLVPGQRYCLYCGARRPDARLEFMDVLVEDFARPAPMTAAVAPPLAPAPVPVREAGVNGWLRQNSPVLAVAGLVLGTLLIGLLIGHWVTDGSETPAPAKAAAPQVIRVDAGAGTTNAATTTPDATATDAPAGTKAKAKDSKKAAEKAADAPAPAPADAVDADSLGTGAAKEKAIEKAAKSGQPISTGGTGDLPPTDDKAPAGGTGFETIG